MFDPHTGNVFSVPRYSMITTGALILALLFVAQYLVAPGRTLRSNWVGKSESLILLAAAANCAWTGATSLTSVDPRVSLLGAYGSYGGFYASLAFLVILWAVAGDTSSADLRLTITALSMVGGGAVAIYGALQLHDFLLGGSRWDFVHWASLPFRLVFSTLGNPNNLAGFIAMVLPATVLFSLRPQQKWLRIPAIVTAFLLFAELVQSGSRGGWIATLAGGGVVVACLAPDLRQRIRVVAAAALAVCGAAVATVALGGSRILGIKFHRLLQTGGASSVHQRLDLWSASLRIAARHPFLGTGPDTFSQVFPRYETASWAHLVGPQLIANGPHNLFMQALAETGIPGLLILIAVLCAVALAVIRAWRSIRSIEKAAGMGTNNAGDRLSHAADMRWLLAIAGGGAAAFVVQGLFNTQDIALTFCFWLFAGAIAALARLATDRAPVDSVGHYPDTRPTRRGSSRLSRPPARRPLVNAFAKSTIALVAIGITVLGVRGAIGPYRADHDYWAAQVAQNRAVTAGIGSPNAIASAEASATDAGESVDLAIKAISLNPWEPLYPGTFGADLAVEATRMRPGTLTQLLTFRSADKYLARAASLSPGEGHYVFLRAQVLVYLAELEPDMRQGLLAAARQEVHHAIADDPRNPDYRNYLALLGGPNVAPFPPAGSTATSRTNPG